MKYRWLITLCMLVGVTAGPASAANKYWSGTGTWNTNTASWGTSPGVYNVARWEDGDSAIFEGTGGTVTLAEDISIKHLNIKANDYTITDNTLSFISGGTITNNGMNVRISSGITGAPPVYAVHPNGWGGPYGVNGLFLSPASSPMELGTLYRSIDNYMVIEGPATGNTIVAIPRTGANRNNKMRWNGPGTWSVTGECYCGEFYVNGGTLITGGRTFTEYRYITPVDGATLVVNGTLEDLTFNGGTLGGTGTIKVPVTVPNSGTLAPGYPTGTLTITNNYCVINGSLDVAIDGDLSGSVDVDGALTISSATLNVNLAGTASKPLIIATYNTLSGEFATLNLPKGGWQIDYAFEEENKIALIPPPMGTVLLIR